MKVLVVVQRYGDEVIGGSEAHARVMAERIALRHEVEVATTTALDYWTWAPHYAQGLDNVGGLLVRRFPVVAGRDPAFKEIEQHVHFEEHTLAEELDWPTRQGPHVPELYEFLHRSGAAYDAILFYTYIYAPTALGLPLVPERSALISTAHDELPLRLAPYRALFQLPRAFGFLTPEERDLVHRQFRNEHIPSEIIGIGLDPVQVAPDTAAFRARHGLSGPVVLYLGQVSEGKGCDELLASWERAAPAATLVLAGTVRMPIPERPDVIALGRIAEAEKWAALAAADALVLPSHLESLGIVLLEAWQVGTPVLVRQGNLVTAGQVARSQGGIAYGNGPEDFDAALAAVLADGKTLGQSGREWVESECAWERVDERLESLLQLTSN